MPFRRSGVRLLIYAVLCALVVSAGAVCAERKQATPGSDRFVVVAEGVTSPDEKHGIRAAYRMWSVPELEAMCAKTPAPATLAPGRTEVTLKAGQPYALTRLVVVARDRAGQALPQVPIVVEAADQQPPLLNLRADALADGSLTPSKPGHFRLRVRALCGTNPVSVVIPASATP